MDDRLNFDDNIAVSKSDHILVARLNENDEPISGGYYSVKDLQDFLIQIQLIDNLTSDSIIGSLTANQGRILKSLIDKKLNSTDLTKENITGLKKENTPRFNGLYIWDATTTTGWTLGAYLTECSTLTPVIDGTPYYNNQLLGYADKFLFKKDLTVEGAFTPRSNPTSGSHTISERGTWVPSRGVYVVESSSPNLSLSIDGGATNSDFEVGTIFADGNKVTFNNYSTSVSMTITYLKF